MARHPGFPFEPKSTAYVSPGDFWAIPTRRGGWYCCGRVLAIDVIGPWAVVLGWVAIPVFWALDMLDSRYALAFLSIVFSLGILFRVCTLIAEAVLIGGFPKAGDVAILFAVAVLEYFGYRQLCNWWRVQGTFQQLRGRQQHWGAMTRRGFEQG